jgi:hypothetical protein
MLRRHADYDVVNVGGQLGILDLRSKPYLEVYDATKDAWSAAPDTDIAMEPKAETVVSHNGDVYIFFLADVAQAHASGRVLKYANGKWEVFATHTAPPAGGNGNVLYQPTDYDDGIFVYTVRTNVGPYQYKQPQ